MLDVHGGMKSCIMEIEKEWYDQHKLIDRLPPHFQGHMKQNRTEENKRKRHQKCVCAGAPVCEGTLISHFRRRITAAVQDMCRCPREHENSSNVVDTQKQRLLDGFWILAFEASLPDIDRANPSGPSKGEHISNEMLPQVRYFHISFVLGGLKQFFPVLAELSLLSSHSVDPELEEANPADAAEAHVCKFKFEKKFVDFFELCALLDIQLQWRMKVLELMDDASFAGHLQPSLIFAKRVRSIPAHVAWTGASAHQKHMREQRRRQARAGSKATSQEVGLVTSAEALSLFDADSTSHGAALGWQPPFPGTGSQVIDIERQNILDLDLDVDVDSDVDLWQDAMEASALADNEAAEAPFVDAIQEMVLAVAEESNSNEVVPEPAGLPPVPPPEEPPPAPRDPIGADPLPADEGAPAHRVVGPRVHSTPDTLAALAPPLCSFGLDLNVRRWTSKFSERSWPLGESRISNVSFASMRTWQEALQEMHERAWSKYQRALAADPATFGLAGHGRVAQEPGVVSAEVIEKLTPAMTDLPAVKTYGGGKRKGHD